MDQNIKFPEDVKFRILRCVPERERERERDKKKKKVFLCLSPLCLERSRNFKCPVSPSPLLLNFFLLFSLSLYTALGFGPERQFMECKTCTSKLGLHCRNFPKCNNRATYCVRCRLEVAVKFQACILYPQISRSHCPS